MATNHYVTKPKRRQRNKRRKDYTRATMLALRTPEQKQLAAIRAMENAQVIG